MLSDEKIYLVTTLSQPRDTREKGETSDKKPPALTGQKSDAAVKREDSVSTNSHPTRPINQTETLESKPNVSQLYFQDNPGNLPPTLQP